MPMLRTLAFLALVVGCVNPTQYEARRPLVPPAVYYVWYTEVEECLGMEGSFESVRWYVADHIERDGVVAGGAVHFPNEITMDVHHVLHEPSVRHESAHHITGIGSALHDSAHRVPCQYPTTPSGA